MTIQGLPTLFLMKTLKAMIYPDFLGDQYTSLGTQTLVPKKHFLSFLFAVVFHVAINNFTMPLIISKWLRRQKCRKKRKNEAKRRRSKRRNCL